MKTIAVFTRDPHKSWATSTVKLDEKEIKLSKEEKDEPKIISQILVTLESQSSFSKLLNFS